MTQKLVSQVFNEELRILVPKLVQPTLNPKLS